MNMIKEFSNFCSPLITHTHTHTFIVFVLNVFWLLSISFDVSPPSEEKAFEIPPPKKTPKIFLKGVICFKKNDKISTGPLAYLFVEGKLLSSVQVSSTGLYIYICSECTWFFFWETQVKFWVECASVYLNKGNQNEKRKTFFHKRKLNNV